MKAGGVRARTTGPAAIAAERTAPASGGDSKEEIHAQTTPAKRTTAANDGGGKGAAHTRTTPTERTATTDGGGKGVASPSHTRAAPARCAATTGGGNRKAGPTITRPAARGGGRRTSATRSGLGAFVAAVLLGLVGCGDGGAPAASGGGAGVGGSVDVFAAASLTESFTRIGEDFEAANPGARVRFNFAGSSQLATQINQGAPADVFAAASPATMKTVTDAGDGGAAPVTFVRNQLVIAVPRGNPRGVTGLADLTRPGVKVALCAEQVPCGAAARTALDAAGVRLTPVTLEQDVKAALSKVKLGEVDAALVYRTDARAASSGVDGVEFPESAGAVNDYPIVVLKDAPHKAAAEAFVAYVRSEKGTAVLTAAGFQAP